MVIHAHPNSVREERLGDLPYRYLAYRVYRWKTNQNWFVKFLETCLIALWEQG